MRRTPRTYVDTMVQAYWDAREVERRAVSEYLTRLGGEWVEAADNPAARVAGLRLQALATTLLTEIHLEDS